MRSAPGLRVKLAGPRGLGGGRATGGLSRGGAMKQVQVEEKVLLNSELQALKETKDKSKPHEAKEAE